MAIGSLRTTERAVAHAWESFTSGKDTVIGVRPEILASWCRCRDPYDVDPRLRSAPGAVERNEHRFEQDVDPDEGRRVGRARRAGDGVGGRDRRGQRWQWAECWPPTALRRCGGGLRPSNLAPRSAWSERTTGTNGMGTALEVPGAVTVTGAGALVRRVSTTGPVRGSRFGTSSPMHPLATIDVSRWGALLPAAGAGLAVEGGGRVWSRIFAGGPFWTVRVWWPSFPRSRQVRRWHVLTLEAG